MQMSSQNAGKTCCKKELKIDNGKEYIPNPDKNHFPIIVSTKQGDVKINITGEIYLSGDTVVNYDNKQADKLWDWLFDLVKNKPELLKNPNEKNLLN